MSKKLLKMEVLTDVKDLKTGVYPTMLQYIPEDSVKVITPYSSSEPNMCTMLLNTVIPSKKNDGTTTMGVAMISVMGAAEKWAALLGTIVTVEN